MAHLVSHDTWSKMFGTAYLMLGVNLLLAVSCSPFLVLVIVADPMQTWPLWSLLAVPCAPAIAGAFAAFRRQGADEGPCWVPRAFAAGWRATLRPALAVGVLTSAVSTVLAVDIAWLSSHRIGAMLIPVAVILIVLTLVTAVHALVAIAEHPDAPLRQVLVASLVLGVRRWFLTALSLIALATLVAVMAYFPGLALALAAAPLWYVVWANCRHALGPVFAVADPVPTS